VEALSCGEALIDLLGQYGVSTVFGIPGVHTLEAYRGLTHSSIRHVLCRHEQGAGFAADGWGRVSRAPGVCLVISGPGVTNVLTPMGQAYHDSKPLLVISGAVSAESHGHGPIHDLPDQRALTAELTAFSHRVEDPQELPGVLARAFEVFECGRPRPVHIAVPVDVLSQVTSRLVRIESERTRPQADGAAVSEAADLLAHARTPVILLGGGAVDAGPDALRVAERIGAAVGLTINGKGAIPSSHPLCLGAALSFRPVSDLIRSADVVVAVGTEFSELDWWGLAYAFAFVTYSAAQTFNIIALFLRFDNEGSSILDPLRDSAYGIYLLHYVPVLWLQYWLFSLSFGPVDQLTAIIKAVIVFVLTLASSWAATVATSKRSFSGIDSDLNTFAITISSAIARLRANSS